MITGIFLGAKTPRGARTCGWYFRFACQGGSVCDGRLHVLTPRAPVMDGSPNLLAGVSCCAPPVASWVPSPGVVSVLHMLAHYPLSRRATGLFSPPVGGGGLAGWAGGRAATGAAQQQRAVHRKVQCGWRHARECVTVMKPVVFPRGRGTIARARGICTGGQQGWHIVFVGVVERGARGGQEG